jgi:hypothetical protein
MRIPITRDTQAEALPPPIKNPDQIVIDTVEVPYMDYHQTHGKPYLVDHFKLGDRWEDPEGGFPKEIQTISSYIDKKIESGEVANSVTAIKDLLKGMEKFNNLTKEERSVVKIEVLAHYVEFLQKNDQTRSNLRKYHG